MSDNETLETVIDYITDVRTLLLDTIQPYRYDDPSLLVSFNVALLEARRLRPDLFIFHYGSHVPSFDSSNSEEVRIEAPFRVALVYGTCGHALMRDQEDVQDARANSFIAAFRYILAGGPQPAMAGGTPEPNAKVQ